MLNWTTMAVVINSQSLTGSLVFCNIVESIFLVLKLKSWLTLNCVYIYNFLEKRNHKFTCCFFLLISELIRNRSIELGQIKRNNWRRKRFFKFSQYLLFSLTCFYIFTAIKYYSLEQVFLWWFFLKKSSLKLKAEFRKCRKLNWQDRR